MEVQAGHLVHPIFFAANRVCRAYRGGEMLGRFVDEPGAVDGEYPEDWLASTVASGGARDEGLVRVLEADGRPGPTLLDLIAAYGEALLGPAHTAKFGRRPGLLCRYLDAATRQPVQCPGSAGSGDAAGWFVLGTREIGNRPPGVLAALRADASASGKNFVDALGVGDDDAMAAALHRIPVHPGQAFFLPPGMPHAVGPGCFVLAVRSAAGPVEEPGPSDHAPDLRPRDQEELLREIRVEEHLLHRSDEGFTAEVLPAARTGGFTVWRAEIAARFRISPPREFAIVVCAAGQGRIGWSGGSRDLRCGEYFLQPFGVPWIEYVAQGRMSLLLVLPPAP
jgi:mannose-6-phosphate isomerase